MVPDTALDVLLQALDVFVAVGIHNTDNKQYKKSVKATLLCCFWLLVLRSFLASDFHSPWNDTGSALFFVLYWCITML